ncbi:G-protein coupled receptor Mth isoform X1 [Helicoverpa armigera]|uniref:G-protein coupled receptor Mth isoform X1 n=1 Tax=Helicoverpa armigera TaxID=29058 RepID=UPI0030829992
MKQLVLTITIILIVHVEQYGADYSLSLLVARQMKVENISFYQMQDLPPPSSVNISKYCNNTSKTCIWKCCPHGEAVIYARKCLPAKGYLSNATLQIYDSKFREVTKTSMADQNTFEMVPDYFSFQQSGIMSLTSFLVPYLTKDGILYGELRNAFDRWKKFEVNHFCVDVTRKGRVVYFVDVTNLITDQALMNFHSTFYRRFALFLCLILLVVVLIVYSSLSHLRDMGGKLLRTLVCCFIVVTVIEFAHCTVVIYDWIALVTFFESVHYFFNLAIFTWLNVMFYDVWRSLRNKNGEFHPSTISRSYLYMKYMLYGFGVPLILTICIVIFENTDVSSVPWFITPKLNSLATCKAFELLVYVYAPGTFLSLFNIYVLWFAVTKENWGSITHLPIATSFYIKNRKQNLERLAQYMKLMIFLTISFCVKSYALWNYDIHPIVSTNAWLLGIVFIVIFLRNQNVMGKFSDTIRRPRKENKIELDRIH